MRLGRPAAAVRRQGLALWARSCVLWAGCPSEPHALVGCGLWGWDARPLGQDTVSHTVVLGPATCVSLTAHMVFVAVSVVLF